MLVYPLLENYGVNIEIRKKENIWMSYLNLRNILPKSFLHIMKGLVTFAVVNTLTSNVDPIKNIQFPPIILIVMFIYE
jgi:hypothetical protein